MERYIKIIKGFNLTMQFYEGHIMVLVKVKDNSDLCEMFTLDFKKHIAFFSSRFPIWGCEEVKLNKLQTKLVKIIRGKK